MLEEMTPKQLIEWRAAVEAEGVDGVQRQIAKLALVVMQALSAFGGGKDELPTEEQLMGLLEIGKPAAPPIELQSGEDQYAAFKQALG